MNGKLHKTDKGWIVEYYWGEDPSLGARYEKLPLHPDDVKYAEEGKEVEFQRAHDLDTGWQWAVLIQPKQQESWDDIWFEYVKTNPCVPIGGDEKAIRKFLEMRYNPPTKK